MNKRIKKKKAKLATQQLFDRVFAELDKHRVRETHKKALDALNDEMLKEISRRNTDQLATILEPTPAGKAILSNANFQNMLEAVNNPITREKIQWQFGDSAPSKTSKWLRQMMEDRENVKNPNMVITGSSGSGMSCSIKNSMIQSLEESKTKDEKLIVIDPKSDFMDQVLKKLED